MTIYLLKVAYHPVNCLLHLHTSKLSHKISDVFHNLINYDYHLIMQKLCKLNLQMNVIPNGLEKYLSFNNP